MKKLIYITLSILAALLFTNADGCGGDENPDAPWRQKKIKAMKDSITYAFTSEKPDENDIKAFEENAKLKFLEFADYYDVFSDTSSAQEFRLQAGKMIRKLFFSDNCNFNFIVESKGNSQNVRLSELLTGNSGFRFNEKRLTTDSVWIHSGLTKYNDTLYRGELGFTNSQGNNKGFVTFINLKKQQVFGNDSLKVWTVLLEDVFIP